MEPQNEKAEEGERLEEAMGGKECIEVSKEKAAEMSRKEKRKAMKKMKRKQVRKETAEKEREEAEAKLNDPVEQEKLKAIEEEEARKREKELREFEESERAWREAMEIKRKKEEEEERRWKELEELRKLEASRIDECGEDEDGEYEYIEEGPPEIIFQGNEIILRKNKVKVPKKSVAQVDVNEIVDRPTSNPLPPGTEAFPKNQNVSSAQQILDNVAQEVPNFGTEQDKAHCPFHLKTGACRFGPRCSRVHFYPDKSCTILMKNMYNGPGIAWEQDEGLEVCNCCHLVMLDIDGLPSVEVPDYNLGQYTDEEAEQCYEEFYEDVHTEFLKYGELINFKVCRNGSFHLRGNVYVHYRSLESAILAYQSINGRYFAGKQVNCEFVNISRWKVAICGEYMKSRLKTCSRGSACNFIHCFRNPGGDYEWADYDKPPPRFWIHKMTALFGYSDEDLKHMEREYLGSDQPTNSQRQPSRRSRSRDHDHVNGGSKPSYRSRKNHGDTRDSIRGHKLSRHEENYHGGDGSPSSTRDGSVEREIYKEPRHAKETSRHESKWSEHSPGHRVMRKRFHERYSDDNSGDNDGRGETSHKRKSSRRYGRRGSDSEHLDDEEVTRAHWSSSERRSRKEDDREGSSADLEESHGHDRVHAVGDKSQRERSSSRYPHEGDMSESRHRPHKRSDLRENGENDRKRSVETSPRDKDRDKSKQRRRHKTGDPDSERSRKGKQEVKRNGKREYGSGSSSDEEREVTQKERSRSSHRKRRRTQHSHEQTPKESEEEEETERWRPV